MGKPPVLKARVTEPVSAYENKCFRDVVRFLLGQKGEPLDNIFLQLLFLLKKQVERVILTHNQDGKAAEELFQILTDLSKKTHSREALFDIYLMIGQIIEVIKKNNFYPTMHHMVGF